MIKQPITKLFSSGHIKTGQAKREEKFRKTTESVPDHVAKYFTILSSSSSFIITNISTTAIYNTTAI